jgi:hypothetical protein
VERAVAREIELLTGVALAVSSTALRRGETPDLPVMRSILRNYSPSRSGDIYLVFEPQWFINDFDGLTVATTHGSPWRYDTFVPLVFAGMDLEPRRVGRRVETIDLAPTVAQILGLKPPSGAAGVPLEEVALGGPWH